MNLQLLLERVPSLYPRSTIDLEIHQVTTDSRQVQPGDLFIAIAGTQSDGHCFIPQAIQNGAAAILVEKDLSNHSPVPVIQVHSTREAFGLVMQAWYRYPAEKLQMTAVTGSNGKSTVAYLLHSLMNHTLSKTGLIGTAGYYTGDSLSQNPLSGPVTTPDPNQLQRLLRQFVDNHCRYAVIEASSFGLEQKRLSGLFFDAILWTNFSPNHHLQYHITEEAYFQAKASLLQQCKSSGVIVLNRDMIGFDQCKQMAPNALSVGFHPQADLVFHSVTSSPEKGVKLNFVFRNQPYEIVSPLVGEFQAYNLAQVFITALHFGIPAEVAIQKLRLIQQIPGRWDIIKVKEIPFTVLVDKANTLTSFSALFKNLQTQSYHRKILVYGQVGGGDMTHRKKTGTLLSSYFDSIILTTDDPENEDPMIGIRQFLEGVPADKLSDIRIELSRAKAIHSAIQTAQPHDLIAVLGRGNQREFLIQGRTEVFDDTVECRKIIRSFGWKA